MSDKSLIKTILGFSFGTWISAAISFFTIPLITYFVLPEDFGKASLFIVFSSIMQLVCLAGTDQSFFRQYHEKPLESRNALLWECLLPSLFYWISLSFLLALFWRHISAFILGEETFLGFILLPLTVLFSIVNVFGDIGLRMRKRYFAFTLVKVVSVSTNAFATILYARFVSRDFYAPIFGILISGVLCSVLYIVLDHRSWTPGKVTMESSLRLLRFGYPFLINSIIIWINTVIDKLSLRWFSTFEEIGIYTAAFKLVSAFNILRDGFLNSWWPIAYERYKQDPQDTTLYSSMVRNISLVFISSGLLMIIFKKPFFSILGDSYHNAEYVAPFLIVGVVFSTISEITVVGINFKLRTKWHPVIASISLLSNLSLNLILVPMFGARGAAVSTGVSYVVFLYVRTAISQRLYPVDYSMKRLGIAVSIMLSAAFANTFLENNLLQLLIALTGLAAVLLLFRSVCFWQR